MEKNILDALRAEGPALPDDVESLRRRSDVQPERSLLLAVLDDAIACFQKYSLAQDPKGKEMFRDAEHWIMEGKNDWLFSFDNVCDLLGLNPEYVRQGLRHWHERAAAAARKRLRPAEAPKRGGRYAHTEEIKAGAR